MKIKLLLTLISVLVTSSCQSQDVSKVDFLEGTWKIENKETYETWTKKGDVFEGYSFKEINGQKRVLETLSIENQDGKIIYTAQVPNQNNGKAIPFILNTKIKEFSSFENLQHDFPKKIQYKKIDGTKIHVSVLGENDKGFSYYIIKQ